jgi:protocatechuate 3,4-dioxygenase beta subunit
MRFRDLATLIAAAFAIVTGQISDRTTGQPLTGVNVQIDGKHAVTDVRGNYAVKGVRPGSRVVTIGSKDVPAQHFQITVKEPSTRFDTHACSTTLDYNCSTPAGLPQNG